MNCPKCGSTKAWVQKRHNYQDGSTGVTYQCGDCKKYFTVRENSTQVQPVKQIVPEEGQKVCNGKKIGISINEFRARHDLNYIVSNVLKELRNDTMYEKDDIVKLTGLRPGYPGLNDVLTQNNDFADFRGRVAGVYYWGHPEVIKQLKDDNQLT